MSSNVRAISLVLEFFFILSAVHFKNYTWYKAGNPVSVLHTPISR